MAANESLSLEYETLISLTDKFTTAISMDCVTVTQKLIARGMIPTSCMSAANETEVFGKVLKAVDIDPENFAMFLDVINECPCIKQLAISARDTYETKKQQQAQEKIELVSQQPKPDPKVDVESNQEQAHVVGDVSAERSAFDRAVIVQQKYYRLVHNFGPVLEPLAAKLLELRVVNHDIADAVSKTDQQTNEIRASALLNAIVENVKSDGESFDNLISALRDFPELSFLGDELETALKIHAAARNVLLIHPKVDRSISLPPSATSGDSQPETDVKKNGTAVQEASQTASKFEYAFPKAIQQYGMSLILDDEPVINEPTAFEADDEPVTNEPTAFEAVAESSTSGSTTATSRHFKSEVSDPSFPNLLPNFTYSQSAVPIPVAYYNVSTVETSKEESGKDCVQTRVVKSKDQYAAQVKKVQKLKTKRGYLVSQSDSEIAAMYREYDKKSTKVEKARKVQFESEQRKELQGNQDDQFIAEEESKLRVMFKDLCERMKKRDENLAKLIDYLEKNLVEEDTAAATATETTPQPNEPDESKLLETPSHTDAFRVMLEHGIPAMWRTIGTLLGVSTSQLRDIERITGSDQDALQKVTFLWLNSPSKYCTWKYLIEEVTRIDKQTASEMKQHVFKLKRT